MPDPILLPPYFRPMLIIILGMPLVASIIFTGQQWYPATFVINWLSNERGEYPPKTAILLNYILILLPFLAILLVLLGLKHLLFKSRS